MPGYRVSYTFMVEFSGDAADIAKAVRSLTYEENFDPGEIDKWMILRSTKLYQLRCPRTVTEEIHEVTPRKAVRKFLYNDRLPDSIDLAKVLVELLDGPALQEVA